MRTIRTIRKVVGFAIEIAKIPIHIPLFIRCFALGVRCGRLGIDITVKEAVALCRW
jgi:hypothetical protein